MDQLDVMLRQKRALGGQSEGLSSVPNYTQELSLKLDRIEYKLDKLLKAQEDQCTTKTPHK